MSRRYQFLVVAAAIILGMTLSACGGSKPAVESHTVGIVTLFGGELVDGLKAGMTAAGYTEGENITYVYDGPVTSDQLAATVQALVEAKVDLIFATSATEVKAAQAVTSDIPIVFPIVVDPISQGIVQDMTHPGGNTTGLALTFAQYQALDQQRLRFLLEADPTISKVFIPYNPNFPITSLSLAAIQDAAASLNVEVVTLEVTDIQQATQASQEIPEDIDALYVIEDPLVMSNVSTAWFTAATERGLPTASIEVTPTSGLLVGYGMSLYAIGQQVTHLFDQILKGANPGDLPVETYEYQLMINLETAQQLGLEIPDSLLERADTIFRPGQGS